MTLCNMGELNIKNGNWDESKDFLEKALKLAQELAPISTVEILANLGELSRMEEQFDDAFRKLEDARQIVSHVGDKLQEINILEKLGDTHIDKYMKEKSDESLSSAEKFYNLALELTWSLNIPLQEARALRGIGYVKAKKNYLKTSKKSFMKSIEIFRRLGAFFELQKTSIEYARSFFEINDPSIFKKKNNSHSFLTIIIISFILHIDDLKMNVQIYRSCAKTDVFQRSKRRRDT